VLGREFDYLLGAKCSGFASVSHGPKLNFGEAVKSKLRRCASGCFPGACDQMLGAWRIKRSGPPASAQRGARSSLRVLVNWPGRNASEDKQGVKVTHGSFLSGALT
jgi:hypothetical protein